MCHKESDHAKMREGNLQKSCNPSENHTWYLTNLVVFDLEEIMNFAMDIEKLNLANFVGKVMDVFMVVPDLW